MRAPAGASVHAGVLILVNARHAYCGSEKAEALRPLPSSVGQVLLHAYAAEALDRLMGSLRGWEQITAVSGWRSAQEQQEIYTHSLHTRGRAFTEQFVALPGCSEHQTGLAVDLALKKDPIDFICPDFPYTGICQTFRQRAAAYGFIQRYPSGKEHVTGIAHEPWHFRYVGTPHAEIMVQNGLVLEEYIAFLRRFPYGRDRYLYRSGDKWAAVSFLRAEEGASLPAGVYSCAVSGNNIDGYIMTEWRGSHG